MSVFGAGRSFFSSAASAPQRTESVSVVSRPLKAAKYVLGIPGRVRDSVTDPIAKRAVSLWHSCRGEGYENACLEQAYRYADQAIQCAGTIARKGNRLSGLVSNGDEAAIGEIASAAGELREGVHFLGEVAETSGWGLRWVGNKIGALSESMHRGGRSLGESNWKILQLAGAATRAASYIPWGVSYAPAGVGHALEGTGKGTQRAMNAVNVRKRLAEELFLPLILKANSMVKTKMVQGALNFGANGAFLYYAGMLSPQTWINGVRQATSTAGKCILGAQAAVGAWIVGPTVKSAVDVARACCVRKDQIAQLKRQLPPEILAKFNLIPGSTDFLLGFFLESNSLLLGQFLNNPEEFLQTFCDWSGVLSTAGQIAMRFARRND